MKVDDLVRHGLHHPIHLLGDHVSVGGDPLWSEHRLDGTSLALPCLAFGREQDLAEHVGKDLGARRLPAEGAFGSRQHLAYRFWTVGGDDDPLQPPRSWTE